MSKTFESESALLATHAYTYNLKAVNTALSLLHRNEHTARKKDKKKMLLVQVM